MTMIDENVRPQCQYWQRLAHIQAKLISYFHTMLSILLRLIDIHIAPSVTDKCNWMATATTVTKKTHCCISRIQTHTVALTHFSKWFIILQFSQNRMINHRKYHGVCRINLSEYLIKINLFELLYRQWACISNEIHAVEHWISAQWLDDLEHWLFNSTFFFLHI